MPPFPKTLLQLHYHDRPCGVTQVMRWYAKAFGSIAGPGGKNMLVCAHDNAGGYPEIPPGSIIDVPEADYRVFPTVAGFRENRQKIADRLFSLLLSPEIRFPVMVVAHNLTLCKNAALVAAFAHVARLFAGQTDRYRFFSAIHDCAEEGRIEQLEEINRLHERGIPIQDDLSTTGAAVLQVAVNSKAAEVYSKAGYPTVTLGNPLVAEESRIKVRSRDICRDRLLSHCQKHRISFDPGKRILAYPARTVARKNPVEAIAMACIVDDANLLLGISGRSRSDRPVHYAIKHLVAEFSLPVVTDIQEIIGGRRLSKKNPIPYIYGIADAVITTSIAESFGYLFYEPYLYGTPVMGRKPVGFYPPMMEDLRFYSRLPVPVRWVRLDVLRGRYRDIGDRCFSSRSAKRAFLGQLAQLLSNDTIDFALLDDWTQIDLVGRIVSSGRRKTEWLRLLEKPLPGWPGLSLVRADVSVAAIESNRRFIERGMSFSHFAREFRRCFSVIPSLTQHACNRNSIQRAFGDPRTFRIR
jgi:hypothetical protein